MQRIMCDSNLGNDIRLKIVPGCKLRICRLESMDEFIQIILMNIESTVITREVNLAFSRNLPNNRKPREKNPRIGNLTLHDSIRTARGKRKPKVSCGINELRSIATRGKTNRQGATFELIQCNFPISNQAMPMRVKRRSDFNGAAKMHATPKRITAGMSLRQGKLGARPDNVMRAGPERPCSVLILDQGGNSALIASLRKARAIENGLNGSSPRRNRGEDASRFSILLD